MKKVFSKLLLCFAIMISMSFTYQDSNITVKHNDEQNCHYDQCHAIAKSTGQRCRHCVSNQGDMYCWQHR